MSHAEQRGSEFEELTADLRAFAHRRDWGQFHTPRNLAMALAGEVGELLAELQWLSDDQVRSMLDSPGGRERLEDEAADVLNYLLLFADVCDIDLGAAARSKIERNESRYPAEQARGSAEKYTRYADQEGPHSDV